MNKEWAEKNKSMQALLKKNTFSEGIKELIELRDDLMTEVLSWKSLSKDKFSAIPYINAEGYHSKTVAYSLWHIFRIEDIVVNSLINNQEEVLFTEDFVKRLNTPIITTGNELRKIEISQFSSELNIDELFEYITKVKEKTEEWLKGLDYESLKRTFGKDDKKRLGELAVVSEDEEAAWLIDYWCNKDVKGLLKMPLSRHWIMHIEASLRIIDKIG